MSKELRAFLKSLLHKGFEYLAPLCSVKLKIRL